MWEAIKNNPLLKTIAIAILGVLGFGFAFNIMFGSNGGEMGHEMSGGYSLNNTLENVLTILIQVLFITIVVIAILAVIKYSRKFLGQSSQNANSNGMQLVDYIKADPILKTVTIVLIGLLLVGLLSMVFSSLFGANRAYNMPRGYHYAMNSGFSLAVLLIALVRFLLTLSVMGLVVGAIALLIQNKSKFAINIPQYFNNMDNSKVKCEKCSYDIKSDWQCCPKCGQDILKSSIQEQSDKTLF